MTSTAPNDGSGMDTLGERKERLLQVLERRKAAEETQTVGTATDQTPSTSDQTPSTPDQTPSTTDQTPSTTDKGICATRKVCVYVASHSRYTLYEIACFLLGVCLMAYQTVQDSFHLHLYIEKTSAKTSLPWDISCMYKGFGPIVTATTVFVWHFSTYRIAHTQQFYKIVAHLTVFAWSEFYWSYYTMSREMGCVCRNIVCIFVFGMIIELCSVFGGDAHTDKDSSEEEHAKHMPNSSYFIPRKIRELHGLK
ncbi:hypothetical protein T484DRAFT_1756188 [Baffinella frigidus]|nr:hypothetical protein T484DRAFT_1756188 [Cryptophyta sp. CCMP2293]